MQETKEKTPRQLWQAEYGKKRRQDPEYKRQAAERSKQWREKNLERSRKNTKDWQVKNKAKTTQYAAQRYANQKKALAAWTDVEMQSKILEMYVAAAEMTAATGIHHQVDHVVPLRSNQVCGLHVWWNLQVIPAGENKQKSAKFDVCLWPEQGKLAFI